jgi:hypothetical protein
MKCSGNLQFEIEVIKPGYLGNSSREIKILMPSWKSCQGMAKNAIVYQLILRVYDQIKDQSMAKYHMRNKSRK